MKLDELLAPAIPADFFSRHWEKRVVYVPGQRDKFRSVFDVAAWSSSESLRSVTATTADERGVDVEIPIDRAQTKLMFCAGMTICADATNDPTVGPLLRALGETLGTTLHSPFAKLYASKRGKGFPLHTDAFHVFVLQLKGRKQWQYTPEPAVASPLTAARLDASGQPVLRFPHEGERMTHDDGNVVMPPREGDLEAVVLEEGDLLYLPPGAWHATEALEDSISLSVSPPRQPLCHLVLTTLRDELLQRPAWRKDLVAAVSDAHDGGVAEGLADLLSARLGELRDLLAALDERHVLRAWRGGVEATRGVAPPLGWSVPREAAPLSARAVRASDVFAHATEAPLRFLVAPARLGSREELVFFWHEGAEWSLPISAHRFLAKVAATKTFRADATRTWDPKLTWEEVASILAQLTAAGVLRRKAAA